MIIARLESLIANLGISDALERAETYLRAGADGIMIHSKREQPDEVFEFAEAYQQLCQRLGFRKPLVCVPTTYNQITEETLKDHGFNVVIYANHLLRAAHQAMQKACTVILENDRSLETESFCSTVNDVFDAVGFSEVKQKDLAYAPPARRAIIPAAGRPDSELLRHFPDLPTCALPLKGKSVLQRQIETLRQAGITDNWVITGFKAEAVDAALAHTIYNPDFDQTYILDSVFRAVSQMTDGFLLAYADILFDQHIVENVLRRREDIVLVVDCAYAQNRRSITKSKIELVTVKRTPPQHGQHYRRLTSAGQEIKLIGTQISKDLATHEFVGLAYFSARGADILKKVYFDARDKYQGERFQEAERFEKAALTDLLQEILDRGFPIHALEITQGWVEIQNFADYQHALEMVEPC